MTLTFATPEHFWGLAVTLFFVLGGLALALRCEVKHTGRTEQFIADLVELDPALLEAFRASEYGYPADYLDRDLVRELAEVKRGRDRHTQDTRKLDEALARLAEARKETSE